MTLRLRPSRPDKWRCVKRGIVYDERMSIVLLNRSFIMVMVEIGANDSLYRIVPCCARNVNRKRATTKYQFCG